MRETVYVISDKSNNEVYSVASTRDIAQAIIAADAEDGQINASDYTIQEIVMYTSLEQI